MCNLIYGNSRYDSFLQFNMGKEWLKRERVNYKTISIAPVE